jgi:nitrogen fixation protein NifQ
MAAIFAQGLIAAPPPTIDPAALYHSLRSEPTACAAAGPFTAHAFACILTIGLLDAHRNSSSLGHAVGLGRDELEDLFRNWLPGGFACVDLLAEPESAAFDDEEEQLRQLLLAHQASVSVEALWLTAMITRRSMSGDHLWQDLGLLDRDELNRLMWERFPGLAARNVANMKWKASPSVRRRRVANVPISTIALALKQAKACWPAFASTSRARASVLSFLRRSTAPARVPALCRNPDID